MKKCVVFIFSTILILSGCGPTKRIVDEIALITALGVDYVNEEEVGITMTVPTFTSDRAVETEFFHERAEFMQDAVKKINEQSNLPLVWGKLELLLMNEEMARQGVDRIKDMFVRDPNIGLRLHLAVVEGTAYDVLKREFWKFDPGWYLDSVIDQNIVQGNLPPTNLHLFSYHFFSDGSDPFLPYFSVDQAVMLDGIALFDDDKYVDRLPNELMFTFNCLYHDFNSGNFSLFDSNGKKVTVKNIHSKRKFEFSKDKKPKITITIHLEGIIREYEGGSITKGFVEDVEKRIEEKLVKESKEIIQRLQELNIDTLELGNYYRSKNRKFDPDKWKAMYPELEIVPKVKAEILEYGIRK
jgi:spore germination protein